MEDEPDGGIEDNAWVFGLRVWVRSWKMEVLFAEKSRWRRDRSGGDSGNALAQCDVLSDT